MQEKQEILPVIFGNDIATYSYARIFHEAAGLRSLVIAEGHRGSINNSAILDVRIVEKTRIKDEAFVSFLKDLAREFPQKQLLLLVNTDEQVACISQHYKELSASYFLPYGQEKAVKLADSKEEMARLITSLGLNAPKRITVDLREDKVLEGEPWKEGISSLNFPVVIKPVHSSDLGQYWAQGLRKVLHVDSPENLRSTLSLWQESGVHTELIVQELIMGDDTTQWVINGYCDGAGNITACGSGRVILGLHQPEYLGNAGIVLTQHNPELIEQAQNIVKAVGLRGFFSMDAKIDSRNGRIYWLDLNPRIGRGHYYLKVAGVDLASAMLKDMRGEPSSDNLRTNTKEELFAIIPVCLANRARVQDPQLRSRIRRLRLARRVTHPLLYSGDRSLKRRFYVLGNALKQTRHMNHFYPKATDTGF